MWIVRFVFGHHYYFSWRVTGPRVYFVPLRHRQLALWVRNDLIGALVSIPPEDEFSIFGHLTSDTAILQLAYTIKMSRKFKRTRQIQLKAFEVLTAMDAEVRLEDRRGSRGGRQRNLTSMKKTKLFAVRKVVIARTLAKATRLEKLKVPEEAYLDDD
jgi:hypothetical protein